MVMIREFSPDSTYVKCPGCSSIDFGDVLRSIRNPLIGHEFIEKNGYSGIRGHHRRKDVYFEDFIKPFLEKKVGSWVYDISPMKNLYLTLKQLEEHASIDEEVAEIQLEESFESSLWERMVLEMPTKLDKRIRLLKEQHRHHTIKNAIKLLEDNFGSVIGK